MGVGRMGTIHLREDPEDPIGEPSPTTCAVNKTGARWGQRENRLDYHLQAVRKHARLKYNKYVWCLKPDCPDCIQVHAKEAALGVV